MHFTNGKKNPLDFVLPYTDISKFILDILTSANIHSRLHAF